MNKIVIPPVYDAVAIKTFTSYKPKNIMYFFPPLEYDFYRQLLNDEDNNTTSTLHRFSKDHFSIIFPCDPIINEIRLHKLYKELYGRSCINPQLCKICINIKRLYHMYKHQIYCGIYFNPNCQNCIDYANIYGKNDWFVDD